MQKLRGLLLLAALVAVSEVSLAQSPTSRSIPESATTTLAANTTQTVTVQLWSSVTGGTLVFSEIEPSLKVDKSHGIAFLLGSQTLGGLNPTNFASGTSLYLDILRGGASVISGGRVPMYATPFSLSPGPQGPIGLQGPMGFPGTNGATGAPGPQGPIGLSGANGSTGAAGPAGPVGPQGTPGQTGATGPQGPVGLTGPTGAAGATGAVGPIGPQGLIGLTGAMGPAGATGPAGPQGSQGLQGLAGSTGPQGASGVGLNFRSAFDPTTTYAVNDVVTYTGSTYLANAANGPNTLTPDANPSAWSVMAQQGAVGPAGSQGLTGAMGPIGLPGATGPQGANGLTGAPGTTGSQGPAGAIGPQGVPGPQGTASMPSGTWNYIASMLDTVSSSHQGAASGVLNGQFLVANGANGSNDTESYNPITNQWTALAPSPAASVYAAGAVMNGQFYMVGGCSPVSDCRVSVSGVMEIYNPTTNTWSYGPSMPTARYDAASAVINGKLYVAGGDLGCPLCTNVSTLEIFDPVANAWTSGSPMPNVLMGARGAAVNGKLYVVGGGGGAWWPSQNYLFASHVSIYDPIANTWTQSASSIPIPVFDPSVVTMNGLVYVISGLGVSLSDVNAVQVYDPTADTWTSVTPLDTGRDQTVAGVISGVVYFAGGLDRLGSAYPTTAESFYQYPQGPAGPQGPIGPTGTQGPQGLQGPIGFTGAAGTPGAPGPQGTPGINGAQGIQGVPGTNGTNGTNGTGFNFRGAFDPNGSYAANDVVTSAPITYNVNLTFNQSQCSQPGCTLPGATPTAVGTVTTDGTIGALKPSNIISFNLTLFDGSHTAILNPSTGASVVGNGLSATTTSLSVDYAVTAGFVAANGQLCFSGNGNCFPGPGAGMWGVGGNNLWVWTGGVEPIATGGTFSQSTYIATAPVAAGSSAPGTAPWATMAAAGAPGTPGTPGAAGAAGPQGLQGPIGFTGAAGTPGAPGPQGTPGLNGLNGVDGTPGAPGQPGPQGPAGPQGLASNPLQVALLRWYPANQTGLQFAIPGSYPVGIAFDGANMWVASNAGGGPNNLSEVRASDGTVLATYTLPGALAGVAFDGANIWVTNQASNTVTKLRASDGTNLGVFSAGQGPNVIVFDGTNIWVTNDNAVTKLRASDGAPQGTFSVGPTPFPLGLAFDGANIWVTNFYGNTVTELRASDGAMLGTFAVGSGPKGVAFDGANIWVTNQGSNTVSKLRASDGATLGTFNVGSLPGGVAFDGANIWVTNYSSNTVTKLQASDGAMIGTFTTGTGPLSIAFDGANIWVTNSYYAPGLGYLSKL